MHRCLLALVLALALLAGTGAAVAAASPQPPDAPAVAAEDKNGADHDVVKVAVWTFAGVLGGAVVFGTLYLFKRRIGAFPQDPSWVAPISIMPSSENPESFGDAPAAEHGSHH